MFRYLAVVIVLASRLVVAADLPIGQLKAEAHRSPVDVALLPDESRAISVNQGSASISLVSLSESRVLHEIPVGEHPAAVAVSKDGKTAWVTSRYGGQLLEIGISESQLVVRSSIPLGFHPEGIALSPDGAFAYVALSANAQVAVVDLRSQQVVKHIDVGRWPRHLDVSPDGKRLVVGTSGDRGVSVVDLEAGVMVALANRFKGLNVGHVHLSKDGQHAYFTWMHYGENTPSKGNIRRGWVLGNRLSRVRVDDPASRETISLDKEGEAVGDAIGVSISPDEQHIVVSAAGTHELLVLRLPDLPYTKVGSSEHIPPELLADQERFCRIPVGGRPMAVRFSSDNRRVYVANYLEDAIQVVDIRDRAIVQRISLGGPTEITAERRGEAIFFDARRSFDQWYSCHSCHFEGGTNAEVIDTLNDGSANTFKTVLPLYKIKETGPWTWHGFQSEVFTATQKSMINTMVAPEPKDEDVRDLVEYLQSISSPPSPFVARDGSLSEAAIRGRSVFNGEKANCATCHSGEHFTDGEIHDVGLSSRRDRNPGFNTPTLRGVFGKVRLLHDGRAKSLEELLKGPHSPEKVTGRDELLESERADLIEYLKTL